MTYRILKNFSIPHYIAVLDPTARIFSSLSLATRLEEKFGQGNITQIKCNNARKGLERFINFRLNDNFMFISAHIAAGLIIGKITHNYPLALAGALLIDIDHLIPYIKHKIIYNPKKFWKTVTNPLDPYGSQRNYLHSFFTWIVISAIASFLINFNIGLILSISYLSHLILDMLDGSDFYPFYPLKYNFIGPIKYLSKYEFLFTLFLFVIFLIV